MKNRWNGIEKPYTNNDVLKLRGTKKIEYTLAKDGSEKLWNLLQEKKNLFYRQYLF